MADRQWRPNYRLLLNMLLWPFLTAIALVSFAAALQWIFTLEIDAGFFELLSWSWLAVVVVVQLAVAFIVVISWWCNLRAHGVSNVTIRHAAVMIGYNSLGKYAPGKILGVLAKGVALYRISGNGKQVVQTTLLEQMAMLHSCGAIALLAWLIDIDYGWTAWGALTLVGLSVVVVSRSGEFLIQHFSRLMKNPEFGGSIDHHFREAYVTVFILMVLVWITSAIALRFCIGAFDYQNIPGFWYLLWVVALGYMVGFLTFFVPAGLGAREGALVVMLGMQMDASVAVYVSISHRVITLLVDVLLGLYAVLAGGAPGFGPVEPPAPVNK